MAKKLTTLILTILLGITFAGSTGVANAGFLDDVDTGDIEINEDYDGDKGEVDYTDDAEAAQDHYDDMEDAVADDEADTTITTEMPSIPKPEFLPGPSEDYSQSEIQDYFREKAIPDFIAGFIGIIGLMSFVSLIVAGIQFLTAYGNEERVASAKRTAIYAVAGFVIAILSYAIVSILGSVSLESTETSLLNIPTAEAVTENTIDDLLPDQGVLIEASPNAQGSSLVEGDLAEDIIPNGINVVLYLVSSIIFATLAYAGVLLVIGQGNEEDINKAKNIIVYAIVGIITIAISYAVIYGIAKLNL